MTSSTKRAEEIVRLIAEIGDQLNKVNWWDLKDLPEIIGTIRGKQIVLSSLVQIQYVWTAELERKELV